MNSEQENQDLGVLQHDAEHEKPHRPNSVLFYLVILFAAAFLLLLMSYFSQQRANQTAMDNLQQTSNSAAESLGNLIAERDALLTERDILNEEKGILEEEIGTLHEQLHTNEAALSQSQTELDIARAHETALRQLNQIRALYNLHRNREARELLAQYTDLESWLSQISQEMSEEEREIYDPLKAYHDITGYLNP